MKRLLFSICVYFTLIASLLFSQVQQEQTEKPSWYPRLHRYIASYITKIFHRPVCYQAKITPLRYRIEYRNREDAILDGCRPCKMCNP